MSLRILHVKRAMTISLIIAPLLLGTALAETGTRSGEPRFAKVVTQQDRVSTVSNIFFHNTNYGILGHDVAGNKAGGLWPRGTSHNYIYGGGVWFGTIKGGKKIVSIGYNPNSGVSQFCPGVIGDPLAADDPTNDPVGGGKGWKYRDDKGANYVLYFATDYDANGVALSGGLPPWPIRDTGNGKPTYIDDVTKRGNYPAYFRSGEDMFAVYKDTDTKFDPEYTGTGGKSVPIGIEVHQTTYSWGLPFAKDYFFIIYEVINKSGTDLQSCYVAPAYDFDIGPNATDDRVRYYDVNPALNLGYIYDSDGVESGWDTAPGIAGIDFLESPIDTVTGKQLGLVTWKNWVIANDPPDDPSRYDFMSSGQKDPDSDAGDKRVLTATGPFTLKAGDTARVVVAMIMAQDLPQLLATDELAQGIYDHDYMTPQPPFAPKVTATPLDHAAYLTWDTTAEHSTDVLVPDSLGRPFVGYRLYRSTSSSGPWTFLKDWNIDNGPLPHSYTDVGDDNGDGVVSSTEILKNNIPVYYYLASYDEGTSKPPIIVPLESPARKDVNLIQVTPVPPPVGYTNARVGSPSTTGALGGVKTPTFTILNQDNFNSIFGGHHFTITVDSYNTGDTLLIPLTVKDEDATIITRDTIRTGLLTQPSAKDSTKAGVRRGTHHWMNVFGYNVLNMDMNWEYQQSKDTFHIASATMTQKANPATNTPIIVNDAAGYAVVASYGKNLGEDDYEIEFLPGGVDTVNATLKQYFQYLNLRVKKVSTGEYITVGPHYSGSAEQLDSVGLEQWQMHRFLFKRGSLFQRTVTYTTNRYYLTTYVDASTIWEFANLLYLNGARIVFDPHKYGKGTGTYAWTPPLDTATADFQAGDKILVSFKGGFKGLFPRGATIASAISPSVKAKVTQNDLDRIKIVPNPYLVGHEGQRTTDEPKLYFNHLPDQCTISIYNVAGDLIATITHNGGSTETWDLLSTGRQRVASQLLIALIESEGQSVMKKFAVITGGFRIVN